MSWETKTGNCNTHSQKYRYSNYLCNPKTNRWSRISTPIGRKIVNMIDETPRDCVSENSKATVGDYVCNPATGRWVLKEGRVGQQVVKYHKKGSPKNIIELPQVPKPQVRQSVSDSTSTAQISRRVSRPAELSEPSQPKPRTRRRQVGSEIQVTKGPSKKELLLAKKLSLETAKPMITLPPGYKMIKKIGSGSFGQIYLASDLSSGQQVAIKKIKENVTQETANSMSTEIDTLIQISKTSTSPYLPKYLDYYYDPQTQSFYYMMEYFDGHSLNEINLDQLTLTDQAQIILQLILGLSDLHNEYKGAHGDIKPSNILINDDGSIKYVGYGLRIEVSSWKKGYDLSSGAPYYRSPENIIYKDDLTAKVPPALLKSSDVWSLGVVIFYILTGRRAFDFGARSIEEINNAILKKSPDWALLPKTFAQNDYFSKMLPDMLGKSYKTRLTLVEVEQLYEKALEELDLGV